MQESELDTISLRQYSRRRAVVHKTNAYRGFKYIAEGHHTQAVSICNMMVARNIEFYNLVADELEKAVEYYTIALQCLAFIIGMVDGEESVTWNEEFQRVYLTLTNTQSVLADSYTKYMASLLP
jgi:lipopolysaccharide biosynthesis regulator YciM